MSNKQRVIVYVDGFNLYFGTKELSNQALYESCLLPEKVVLSDGYELRCPDKWK